MKKRTVRFARIGAELLCLVLVLSMIVCSIPLSAAEADSALTTGTAEDQTAATVDIVKLKADVVRGTRLTREDLEIVRVKNVNVPANAISDIDSVIGNYAKQDLYAGEYLAKGQSTESKVSKANNELLVQPIAESNTDFVIVTDYVIPNTGEPLDVFLQELIDVNPRRTIYFPDGEYVIQNPLFTAADGKESVSIQLADGAVIKADKNFKTREGSALLHIGGARPKNDIQSLGSYYVVSGGTLDGNNVADGISVDSGRESVFRNLCIRNPKLKGIYVAKGANNGSSDLDFEDITIIGTGMLGSVGMDIDGYDNTFTNIRVYNMSVGMNVKTGGNLLKSIYVSIDADKPLVANYTEGIKIKTNNWVSACHVVNVQTAFSFGSGSEVWDCSAEWTTTKVTKQIMFKFSGNNLTVSGCRADFCVGTGVTTALVSGSATAKFIEATAIRVNDVTDKSYENYLVNAGTIIPRS